MKDSSSRSSRNFTATREYLFGLRNGGSKLGVERMVRFAAAAGDPQNRFPTIHVAGTNGKGSVCAFIEGALRLVGMRTGLYTSPHLVHLGERIQVDRQSITEAEIVEMTEELRIIVTSEFVDGDCPSFFEFMTLMAFLQFAAKKVDCAVVEVGLGGRLDATNILNPEVSVITSIGLDHSEILGDTLAKIAAEKAGIIKENVPVVLGRLPAEAEKVVRQRALDLGSKVISVEERFTEDNLPETNLMGEFQRWNAATATLALEVVQDRLPVERETMNKAFLYTEWAGRWEERCVGGRGIIFDSTHNSQGAVELEKNLKARTGPPEGRLDVVVGSLGKMRAEAVIRVIVPYARRIFFIRPSQPRALSFQEMRDLTPKEFKGELINATVEEIFPGGDVCRLPDGAEPVLVTGSIYLIGEIYGRIQGHGLNQDDQLQDCI